MLSTHSVRKQPRLFYNNNFIFNCIRLNGLESLSILNSNLCGQLNLNIICNNISKLKITFFV